MEDDDEDGYEIYELLRVYRKRWRKQSSAIIAVKLTANSFVSSNTILYYIYYILYYNEIFVGTVA